MGLVHHTDADREWAYDRESHIGRLDKALDEAQAKGWTVVDMKKDWKRRFLRRNMPQAEIILWAKLRGTGLKGHKFRRQYSVKNYVLDFYCPKQKLAIEIDGNSHFIDGAEEYDRERQAVIESYGIKFLRFTNTEVSENIEGVVMTIIEHLP